MMYIDDCIRSIVEMMNAPKEKLNLRTYNVTAMSFSPDELAAEICKHIPNMRYSCEPDFRQSIGEYLNRAPSDWIRIVYGPLTVKMHCC